MLVAYCCWYVAFTDSLFSFFVLQTVRRCSSYYGCIQCDKQRITSIFIQMASRSVFDNVGLSQCSFVLSFFLIHLTHTRTHNLHIYYYLFVWFCSQCSCEGISGQFFESHLCVSRQQDRHARWNHRQQSRGVVLWCQEPRTRTGTAVLRDIRCESIAFYFSLLEFLFLFFGFLLANKYKCWWAI